MGLPEPKEEKKLFEIMEVVTYEIRAENEEEALELFINDIDAATMTGVRDREVYLA